MKILKKKPKISLHEDMSYKKYELAMKEIYRRDTEKIITIIFISIIALVSFTSFIIYFKMASGINLIGDPEIKAITMNFIKNRVKNFSICISFVVSIVFILFLFWVYLYNLIFVFLKPNLFDKYLLKGWRIKKDYVTIGANLRNFSIPNAFKIFLIGATIFIFIFPTFFFDVEALTFFIVLIGFFLILVIGILLVWTTNFIKIGFNKGMTRSRLIKLLKANNFSVIISIFCFLLIFLPSLYLVQPLFISSINKEISIDNALKESYIEDFKSIVIKKELYVPTEFFLENIEYFTHRPLLEAEDIMKTQDTFTIIVLAAAIGLACFFYAIPIVYLKGLKVIYYLLISFLIGIFLTKLIYWYVSKISFLDLNSWIVVIILTIIIFLGKKYVDSFIKQFESKT